MKQLIAMIKLIPYPNLSSDEHRALLSIRNEARILQYTLSQTPIAYEQHLSWVQELQHTAERLYYAVFVNDEIKGAVHATELGSSSPIWGLFFAETTLPIVPSAVALFFLDILFKQDHATCVQSWVHEENLSAVKFNHRLGFQPSQNQNGFFTLWILHAQDWKMQKNSKLFKPIADMASHISLQRVQ